MTRTETRLHREIHPLRLTTALTLCLATLGACGPAQPIQDGPAERIVSLVPTVTEVLFAIGAGNRVVGISDFDGFPPEALDRPRVGALINPNLERIFELQPDLVITYGTQFQLHDRLAVAGIRQVSFETGSIEHILDSIGELGRAVGMGDAGSRLAEEIGDALDRLRASRPAEAPKVLLVHTRDVGTLGSFYSAGSDSYFNELLDIAGGRNVFDDVRGNAFQPSLEEVLARKPDVIVELLPDRSGNDGNIDQRRRDWDVLSSLPAVRNGRVHVLSGDYLLLVGPRLHLVARALADAIRAEGVSEN